mgnify:CR=1 FL=1
MAGSSSTLNYARNPTPDISVKLRKVPLHNKDDPNARSANARSTASFLRACWTSTRRVASSHARISLWRSGYLAVVGHNAIRISPVVRRRRRLEGTTHGTLFTLNYSRHRGRNTHYPPPPPPPRRRYTTTAARSRIIIQGNRLISSINDAQARKYPAEKRPAREPLGNGPALLSEGHSRIVSSIRISNSFTSRLLR